MVKIKDRSTEKVIFCKNLISFTPALKSNLPTRASPLSQSKAIDGSKREFDYSNLNSFEQNFGNHYSHAKTNGKNLFD